MRIDPAASGQIRPHAGLHRAGVVGRVPPSSAHPVTVVTDSPTELARLVSRLRQIPELRDAVVQRAADGVANGRYATSATPAQVAQAMMGY